MTRRVVLVHHLALRSVQCLPLANTPLQRAANAGRHVVAGPRFSGRHVSFEEGMAHPRARLRLPECGRASVGIIPAHPVNSPLTALHNRRADAYPRLHQAAAAG
jgi:hypothetical protein